MDSKEIVDKRKHTRFRSQDLAFAAFGSHSKEIGEIIDISMGGLAFLYIADGDQINESRELEIYLAKDDFHLKEVPFNTISDFELPNEFPTSSIIMRRRGVQFGDLRQDQVSQLGYFNRNHTVGEV